ncbi:MAG: hypothetical protein ABEJ87_01890 [Candidatus Nanohalobium sp.]
MRKTALVLSALVVLTASVSAKPPQKSSSTDPGMVPGDLLYPLENFVEGLEVGLAGMIGGRI